MTQATDAQKVITDPAHSNQVSSPFIFQNTRKKLLFSTVEQLSKQRTDISSRNFMARQSLPNRQSIFSVPTGLVDQSPAARYSIVSLQN